jgi:hypothetical protein
VADLKFGHLHGHRANESKSLELEPRWCGVRREAAESALERGPERLTESS